ncbi:hypothetical protein HJC23_011673 [Cyclotella cryptica]|uniref:Hexosyltransferase n=1 Tax=Cyclotella cryptica TaxID=29204 RepID=A0ABD3QLM9_9STRA
MSSSLRLLMLLIGLISVLQIILFNYLHVHAETKSNNASSTGNKISIATRHKTQSYKHTTDVIVYLAQFKDHSTYGAQYDAHQNAITGLSKLNKSLDLLYTNYVHHFPACHILIFHDASDTPTAEVKSILSKNRPQLQFRQLDGKWWELPYGLKPQDRAKWKRSSFSIGYRHMMRWFAILIWEYLANEGYTHVMRMDDDSYLHSQIKYNLFDYMRDNNKRYGFRMPVVEDSNVPYEMVNAFLKQHPHVASPNLIASYKQNREIAFYNNWFIADILFFLSPPASLLLDVIDKSKIIYTNRTGDLAIHSTVVRLFLHPEQIEYFRDFTYEHMTLCSREICRGCPQNGGVARGIGAHSDEEWFHVVGKHIADRFRDNPKCLVPMGEDFIGADDVRECSRLRSQCGYYLKMLLGVAAP